MNCDWKESERDMVKTSHHTADNPSFIDKLKNMIRMKASVLQDIYSSVSLYHGISAAHIFHEWFVEKFIFVEYFFLTV